MKCARVLHALTLLLVVVAAAGRGSFTRSSASASLQRGTHRARGDYGRTRDRQPRRSSTLKRLVPVCAVLGFERAIGLSALTGAYAAAQATFPRMTCVSQGILLSVVGDVLSQHIAHRKDPPEPGAPQALRLSRRRITIAAFAGIVFDGFVIPTWYAMLHSLVPAAVPLRGLVMTAIDLCILSTLGNASNMTLRNFLASGSLAGAWRETRSKLAEVILLDLRVFPLYDIIVFSFVPKHIQALCTACVCCLWNCYLASQTAHGADVRRIKAMPAAI